MAMHASRLLRKEETETALRRSSAAGGDEVF